MCVRILPFLNDYSRLLSVTMASISYIYLFSTKKIDFKIQPLTYHVFFYKQLFSPVFYFPICRLKNAQASKYTSISRG